VLWFTNAPVPEMIRAAGLRPGGIGGHWISELFRHAAKVSGFDFGVVTAFPGLKDGKVETDRGTFYSIGQPARYPAFSMQSGALNRCLSIIDDFEPDLLHIHGSERFYGLVKSSAGTDIPTALSIQGLLGPCSTWSHFFGALTPADIWRSTRLIELPLKYGLSWQYYDLRKAVRREKDILAAVDAVFGRTAWDKAHAKILCPQARYHRVGEILRPAFANSSWDLSQCNRHTLISTNVGHPRRGTENLFAAVAILKDEFPDIRLRLAGTVSTRSGYGRFLHRKIAELNIGGQVEFLGYLGGEDMARELSTAHVFASTSYIENSSNSLSEAMVVGIPCVASFFGGTPSMVSDGENGILYPVDDIPLLAESIRKLFVNDTLSENIGRNARELGMRRHDPKHVIDQLIDGYEAVSRFGSGR
jgi:glycosyltransferase involved in cell wall biosynthesis